METVTDFIMGAPKSLQMVTTAMKLRHLLLGRKAMTNLDKILKSRDITLPTKVYLVKAMVFPVIMHSHWTIMKVELDYNESWVQKNWCFSTVVLEKTLESPLESKEIKPVNPKRNQSWIFIARTDEAEAPILWPPDAKHWLIGKDPDAGKDWRQQENGMTEDEMVGWHHWVNGHEFEQAMGVGEGQEHWHAAVHGVAKSQTWLSDWTELNWIFVLFCKKRKLQIKSSTTNYLMK